MTVPSGFAAESACRERHWLAGELHAGLCQQWTALATQLMLAEADLPADRREALGDVRALASRISADLRSLMSDLNDWGVQEHGLPQALRRVAQAAWPRYELKAVVAWVGPEEPPLAPTIASAAVRVTVEALAHAARHGRAAGASVVVHRGAGELRLVIEDDGDGTDGSDPAATASLELLQARATSAGGRLTVEVTPERGTALFAAWPDDGGAP